MIVHINPIHTFEGVKAGLEYQVRDKENPEEIRGKLLAGNPNLVLAYSKISNSRKVKAYSVLVSFAEDKNTLLKKLEERGFTLEDLIEDIKKFLFAGYKEEEVAYSFIAHEDTDNFHLHIHIANNFAGTGKTLKFWFSKKDLETFRKYIDLKYGLISPDFDRKETISQKVSSKKWKSPKHRNREILKEELHEFILEGIQAGLIEDRESLIKFLEKNGIKVNRKGKNYISVEIEGIKIRLKGGIYDEDFRVSKLIKETERGIREAKEREYREIQERIRQYYERKNREIAKRYGNIRKQLSEKFSKSLKPIPQRVNKRERKEFVLARFSNRYNNRRDIVFSPFVFITSEILKDLKKELKMYKNEAERLKHEIELPKLLSYFEIPFYYAKKEEKEEKESKKNSYIVCRVLWRKDRNPSLLAHRKNGKWLWLDLAKEEGGSVIDFVMKYKNLSFKEALKWLKEHEKEIKQTEVKPQKIHKLKVANIRKPKTEEEIKWLAEVWKLEYLPPYTYLGDKLSEEFIVRDNKKGGKEIVKREIVDLNPVLVFKPNKETLYWREIEPFKEGKGWLTPNKPVFVEGENKNIYVVEGFTDYLTLFQTDINGNYLVLGTVHNREKVVEFLKEKEREGYNIFLVLDNDNAGKRTTEYFQERLNYAVNLSQLFEEKDFCDFYLNAKEKGEEERLEEFKEKVSYISSKLEEIREREIEEREKKEQKFGYGLGYRRRFRR